MTRKLPLQTFLFDEAVPELKGRPHLRLLRRAGGASTGIEWALGRSPDVAINHCEHAVRVHALNHPDTDHVRVDVWDVDPRRHLPPGTWTCRGSVGLYAVLQGQDGTCPSQEEHPRAGVGGPAVATRRRPRVIFIENVPGSANGGRCANRFRSARGRSCRSRTVRARPSAGSSTSSPGSATPWASRTQRRRPRRPDQPETPVSRGPLRRW